MRDECAVITHHESGHTVAALMTVSNDVDVDKDITVRLINGRGDGGAELLISGDHPVQAAFVIYAGPWADARVQWGSECLNNLDDEDVYGTSFRAMVGAAFAEGRGLVGGGSDHAIYQGLNKCHPDIVENEELWCSLLERAWPVIEELARELQSRFGEPEIRVNGFLSKIFHTASIPGAEAVALVRPLLEDEGLWRYLS